MGIADKAALIAHKLRYSGSSKEYYPLAKVGGNGRSKSMCQASRRMAVRKHVV